MRFTHFLVPLGLAAAATASLAGRKPEDAESLMSELNEEAYEALRALEEEKPGSGSCSILNATIRRDWVVLSMTLCFCCIYDLTICFL